MRIAKCIMLWFVISTILYGCGTNEKKTIKVLAVDNYHNQIFQVLTNEFKNTTGIKVNFVRYKYAKYAKEIDTNITNTDTKYDLVILDERHLSKYSHLFLEYDKWPEGHLFNKTNLKELFGPAVTSSFIGQENYALPVSNRTHIWVTNKEILNNYDVKFPYTINSLLISVKKINENGSIGYIPLINNREDTVNEALFFLYSYGTKIFTKKDGVFKIIENKNNAIKAISIYKELLDYSTIVDSENHELKFPHNERFNIFKTNNAFSMLTYPEFIPSLEKFSSKVKELIIYSTPPKGTIENVTIQNVTYIGLPLASQKQSLASDFSYWLLTYKNAIKLLHANIGSVRKDVYDNEELLDKFPWLQIQKLCNKISITKPHHPQYDSIINIIYTNWMKAIKNKIRPEEAIDNIEKELEKII